jgi:hypothetical protein
VGWSLPQLGAWMILSRGLDLPLAHRDDLAMTAGNADRVRTSNRVLKNSVWSSRSVF